MIVPKLPQMHLTLSLPSFFQYVFLSLPRIDPKVFEKRHRIISELLHHLIVIWTVPLCADCYVKVKVKVSVYMYLLSNTFAVYMLFLIIHQIKVCYLTFDRNH